ncbi:MAG: M23 family metallopeptidase [Nanoarchaeota archaeon]|nr:M23 family metallopeptidase [Nanoarchaeota archaeon]
MTFSKNVYRLPFEDFGLKPEPAPFHEGKSWLEYALDFAMPLGTPLYAALDGKVVDVVDRFVEGGANKSFSDKVNMIVIVHENDEFTHYVHLKRGILFRPGEAVEKGILIGHSGETGYMTYPHLHFSVSVLNPRSEYKTIIPRFRKGKKIFTLESPR